MWRWPSRATRHAAHRGRRAALPPVSVRYAWAQRHQSAARARTLALYTGGAERTHGAGRAYILHGADRPGGERRGRRKAVASATQRGTARLPCNMQKHTVVQHTNPPGIRLRSPAYNMQHSPVPYAPVVQHTAATCPTSLPTWQLSEKKPAALVAHADAQRNQPEERQIVRCP